MTIEIPLSKTGKVNAGKYIAIIDDCDADLAKLNWNISSGKQYAVREYCDKEVRIHRVILERVLSRSLIKGECVDHINGNGLDNRRENLRVATLQQNCRNQKKHFDQSSGYKGVTFNKKNKKYYAQINANGKRKHLGAFEDPKDAYNAYCEAAVKYFGEFARFE